MGDVMGQDYKNMNTNISLLEMKDFTAEHIRWLQDELKKPDNFLWDEGRQVMVNTQDGIDAITIPSKDDKKGFLNAWLKVYNTCLATLDIDVKIICYKKRSHVRKTYNQVVVGNFAPVTIPEDTKTVEYVVALEKIINNYKKLYEQLNVSNSKASEIKVEKHEITLEPVDLKLQGNVTDVAKTIEKKGNIINFNDVKTLKEITRQEFPKVSIEKSKYNTIEPEKDIVMGQKIPDGDKLTKKECLELSRNADSFILITCTNLDKDEGTFINNAENCIECGLEIGAYINGRSKNVDDVIKENKKILNLLNGYDISGPVIYELNLDYLKEHDSEEDFDNMIKAYNGIASILTESGYNVLIATDLDTGVLLERQLKRKNIPNIYPLIYRIVPREVEQISEDTSYVLMDPQYENDIVKIVNPLFKIKKSTVKNAA